MQVRAILAKHLETLAPAAPASAPVAPGSAPFASASAPVAPASVAVVLSRGAAPLDGDRPALDDPNRLEDPARLVARLEELRREAGPAAVRRAGRAYIELWGRTFATLVRHLRARPERALNLFASELYPFLRGDRLAARVEGGQGHRARLVLAPGLPDEYCAGLIEGAVALSGCRAACNPLGNGHYDVRYTIPAAQRLARLMQAIATLRIPLLLAAGLAGAVGAAVAWSAAPFDLWRLPAAILAVLAVQGAANAYHDYAAPTPAGPLSPWRPARSWLVAQMAAGYGFAAFVGGVLFPAAPSLLVFVPVGLAASILYHRVRDHGLGPLLVAFTHGPLIALGVLHALVGHRGLDVHVVAVLASIPVGAIAAAVRTLDDLADRPLDEAGGRRTLAVRLPGRQNALLYAALVGLAVAVLAGLAAMEGLGAALVMESSRSTLPGDLGLAIPLAFAAVLGLGGAILVHRVRGHLDDPNGLAAARAGTIALHVACAMAAVALLGVGL